MPPITPFLPAPLRVMKSFGEIGSSIGNQVNDMASSAFGQAMMWLWQAVLVILREAFMLADRFAVFTVDTESGPIGALWPMLLWISAALALGLFFWQIAVSSVRGGHGFLRVVIGPAQYGVALAVTVGVTAMVLAAADGLTYGILHTGLRADNFHDAINVENVFSAEGIADAGSDVVKVVLGILAVVALLPAGFGFILEMLFREAAIYVLVATVPITAAGLLAQATVGWYWTTLRWLIAAILMKPVLALVLVLGVAISAEAQGLSGLMAGAMVLWISLLCPLVVFKLLVFVDPNTDAGAGLRKSLSSVGIGGYNGKPNLPGGSGSAGGSGGGGAQESATEDRFTEGASSDGDQQTDGHDGDNTSSGQDSSTGESSATSTDQSQPTSTSGQAAGSGDQDGGTDPGPPDGPAPPHGPGPPDDPGPSGPSGGGGSGGSGPSGPSSSSGGGGGGQGSAGSGAQTTEMEETAVTAL